MTRSQKEQLIAALAEEFASSEAVLVCDFRGLSTKSLEALRDSARASQVRVRIIKNTLAKLALERSGKAGLDLRDTNIYLWANDALVLSKVAVKFEEENEHFAIKLAHLNGELAPAERVAALAKLPSRDELLAMLAQVWKAPITNFVMGLNALKNQKEG